MRNHPLTLGEVVFDLNQNYFGVITELGYSADGKQHAKISMVAQSTYPNANLPIGWCEYENKIMMDCEITENDLEWETDDVDALYQIAWGVKDVRTENIVCYEHQESDDEYPYYSPYWDENLYNFEVEYC